MTYVFNLIGELSIKLFITVLGATVLGGILFTLFIIINSL